jgi:hypothetical protein
MIERLRFVSLIDATGEACAAVKQSVTDYEMEQTGRHRKEIQRHSRHWCRGEVVNRAGLQT